MKIPLIPAVIFLLAFIVKVSAQEIKLSGKWWSVKYQNGNDNPVDTLVFNAETKEMPYGIQFSDNGDYKKMTGWHYCGTYVHQNHLKENPPIYENGKWALIKGEEKTYGEFKTGNRNQKYRLISGSDKAICFVVVNN
jgi:hypothetical protein